MPEMVIDSRETQRWRPILQRLALTIAITICVYTLSYNGSLRVDDEHILAARAQSLALWGEFSEPQVYGNLRVQELMPLGDQATMIEPAQTVLAATLYKLGIACGVGGLQATFLLNIFVTALASGFIFLTVLVMGHPANTALWCGLLFSLGTMAWPYATTFYRDSLAMAMVALAFLGWALALRSRRAIRVFGLALSVLAIGAGVLTKNSVWALVPALVLTGAVVLLWELRRGACAVWWIGVAIVGAIVGVIVLSKAPETGPLARFSLDYYSFLVAHFKESLRPELIPAVLGPFLSPAKSVLLFSPPLLLIIPGILWSWSQNWRFTLPALLFAASVALAQGLFYRELWAGFFGWGLRYMLVMIPPWVVVSAPAVRKLLEAQYSRRRWVLWSLLVMGMLVQWSGAWVSWIVPYAEWKAQGLDPYGTGAAWDARMLAPVAHLRHLADPITWDVAWARLMRSGSSEAALVPIIALVLLVTAATLLWMWRSSWQKSYRKWIIIGLVGALTLVLPFFPTLWVYQADPALGGDRPNFQHSLEWVEAGLEPGDAVVVDSYGTPLWAFMMNRWDAPVRWYSLPFEIPGSPDVGTKPESNPSEITLVLFEELSMKAGRLWYVTSEETPDYGLKREVTWLTAHHTVLAKRTFSGESKVEVFLYRLNPDK